MTRRTWIARTRLASGRFLLALTLPLWAACQGPSAPAAAAAPRFEDPVLERGSLSATREARAAELFHQAREALEAGASSDARALAFQVVEVYPQAPVSGLALFTYARASLEVGALDEADTAAGRFAALLAPGDPRVGEARLLQADVQARRGDQAARLSRLLAVDGHASSEAASRAVNGAREAAARLEIAELESVLSQVDAEAVARPVVLARYAALLQAWERTDEAARTAREALDAGVRGTDSLTAVAVLAGETRPEWGEGPRARTLTLATVLPTGGSPAFRDFALSVAEGIEVAAATYLDGITVTLEARDDQGEPALAAAAVAELEAGAALGAVGFLERGALEAAADRRTGTFPLVSPTARVARGEGTYTLSGADPQGAAAVARYAAREGFTRVAMIHSRSAESVEEADAFEAALRGLGIPLVGRFSFEAGATYFQEQVRGAQEALRGAEIRALGLGPDDTLHVEVLEPVALFVPVPAEDVELLAPQLTFFGLDTLAIRILGTGGWTDAQTLETVDDRHTTGVVATAHVSGGPGSPGYARFKEAYEGYFRRSLVSPVPALGYDAALLLLEGAREGPRTREQLHAAMERVRSLEGATGTFSVVGGKVMPSTRVVRIEHGILIPTN